MTETKCCKPFSRGTTLLLVWSALMSFVLLSMAANLISLTFNFSNSYTVYTPASHWVDQWFFAWKVSCYYCWKLSISSCIFIHFDIICHATVWLDNTEAGWPSQQKTLRSRKWRVCIGWLATTSSELLWHDRAPWIQEEHSKNTSSSAFRDGLSYEPPYI